MTDDQFERIKKGLNFHSEGGVYNLCTLTETALREIIEDAAKELEAQIEKMKCCQNCLHLCARCELGIDGCYVCSKWELRR